MRTSDIGVLVVEGELGVREFLMRWCQDRGYTVGATESASSALMQLYYRRWNVMLVDSKILGSDGDDLIRRVKEIDKEIKIIVMVPYGSLETALRALKAGAFDFVSKPIDRDYLSHLMDNALSQQRLTLENERLRDSVAELLAEVEIIGSSPELDALMEMIHDVSNHDNPVMIRGERGTGKGLIARALHANSKRRFFPFVTVKCGMSTESDLERELFGDENFPAGHHGQKGKLEIADCGSLFLSGIGGMDTGNQMQFLHALETGQFSRVGGGNIIRSDFRVICATDENLEASVKKGTFREDLFYHLNAFTINLSPLRTRHEDIVKIAHYFLERYCRALNKRVKGLSVGAIDLLKSYNWPGNVRELENAIERAVIVAEGPTIGTDDLPVHTKQPQGEARKLRDIERMHVEAVLKETGWNISRSAVILGIDRVTLYNKIARYGLKRGG